MQPRTTTYQKPPLRPQSTTLWDYPSQHYGSSAIQGDKHYVGATPSYVIWNIITRYTQPGDLIVDPMCGSGTTLDVAKDTARKAQGFDLNPYRPDIVRADARALPLKNKSVDCVFVDPPYGDHIHYSDSPACMGKLSAYDDAYFEALEDVVRESVRILKPGCYAAFYVCDFFNKKQGFVPIGARLAFILSTYATLVDHVAVVRHHQSLNLGNYHQAAVRDGFFLRGFNHLLIART